MLKKGPDFTEYQASLRDAATPPPPPLWVQAQGYLRVVAPRGESRFGNAPYHCELQPGIEDGPQKLTRKTKPGIIFVLFLCFCSISVLVRPAALQLFPQSTT